MNLARISHRLTGQAHERPPLLRCACSPCSTDCESTPVLVKRRAPRTDRPLMHFASPPGEKCGLAGRIVLEPVGAGRPQVRSRAKPESGQATRQLATKLGSVTQVGLGMKVVAYTIVAVVAVALIVLLIAKRLMRYKASEGHVIGQQMTDAARLEEKRLEPLPGPSPMPPDQRGARNGEARVPARA